MRNDGIFDAARAGPSLEAAGRLALAFAAEIVRFKAIVDPD